jgi:ATP adenylyltransferase
VITLADIDARTREALACGALARIETIEETIPERGAEFVVRRVSSLARKAEAARPAGDGPRRNPFLPPERELTVGAIGPAHLAVLNKYPVLDRHLLVVTREFAPQEALIDASDFAALAAVMRGFPSLGFYNGGKAAGASQPHKHLQVVPLPLGRGEPPFPVAPWLAAARIDDAGSRLPQFDFAHAVARFDAATIDVPDAGTRLAAIYRALLGCIGIAEARTEGLALQSAPYNLLVGRDWMLAVRRAREHADGISVNTLGYAGSLFVKDETQLALVRRIGPLAVLRSVAAPAGAAA